jgi:hypothetical protein
MDRAPPVTRPPPPGPTRSIARTGREARALRRNGLRRAEESPLATPGSALRLAGPPGRADNAATSPCEHARLPPDHALLDRARGGMCIGTLIDPYSTIIRPVRTFGAGPSHRPFPPGSGLVYHADPASRSSPASGPTRDGTPFASPDRGTAAPPVLEPSGAGQPRDGRPGWEEVRTGLG